MNPRLFFYRLGHLRQPEQMTLDPDGPGVVRVHLVPPKFTLLGKQDSVLIINGQEIVSICQSYSVLLKIFMEQLASHANQDLSDEELRGVYEAAIRQARWIFYKTKNDELEEDLHNIVNTLWDIAKGFDTGFKLGNAMTLREYAKNMKAPHRMDLMVSAMTKDNHHNCNQKCLHCYAEGQYEAEKTELTTQQWKHILDILRKNGVPQVTFTGGEPTMREDLPELIAHAEWFISRVNTNGRKLTPEYCDKLRTVQLDSIQITLYSDDKEKHNLLVGMPNTKCWDETVNGIKNAINGGLNTSVNTPLCLKNKDYVSTLKLIKELGVRYVSCSGLIITGNATSDESRSTQLSKDEITAVVLEAKKFCDENGMELNFTSPGWIDEEVLRENGIAVPSCGACLSNMAIAPDGTVVPCQSWLRRGAGLGNILNTEWKKIWNSLSCKKIRSMTDEEAMNCPLRKGGDNQ